MPKYEWTDHVPTSKELDYIADLRCDGRSVGFVRLTYEPVAHWTVPGMQGRSVDLQVAKRMVERMLREQGHDLTALLERQRRERIMEEAYEDSK